LELVLEVSLGDDAAFEASTLNRHFPLYAFKRFQAAGLHFENVGSFVSPHRDPRVRVFAANLIVGTVVLYSQKKFEHMLGIEDPSNCIRPGPASAGSKTMA
jgi:hypothetical protein